jgi:murein DD-endopeptidase MepM/ murein hydrolase activator NlpD
MLEEKLKKYAPVFHPVVPFEWGRDKLYLFDFTDQNTELTSEQIADTDKFANYINAKLKENGCRYGIGGYNEHRTLYARSKHYDHVHSFASTQSRLMDWAEDDSPAEPRRLHLGIDIWGPTGTAVMAPMDGIVHSFAFNNNDSDYGATIILTHILEGVSFHSLYGHLSLNSLKNLHEGKNIRRGEVFTEFGMRFENGNWPPHLHFQLIKDMQGWNGDYPGVCKYSERDEWLGNCPDPDLVLQMSRQSGVLSRET